MQKSNKCSASKRSAFTLIEILVVIAIIAILASLLLGGVMMVLSRGPVVTTQNDILQLSTAMNNFYGKYSFYPPNRLRLCSSRTKYATAGANTTAQEDNQSIAALSKMFPALTETNPATGISNWTNIAWDGSGNTALDVTLEGDQVLVFILGGIPDTAAGKPPLGFSTNAANPAAAATAANPDRIKWMTSWDSSRIALLHPAATSKNFPSYLDGFAGDLPAPANPATGVKQKQPYLYFSSMGVATRENGYDPTASGPPGTTVSPYIQKAATATAPASYWKSNTFQIISAGKDGTFGPGGLWPSTTGGPVMDDMSNFNGSVLGAPD
jgi:prepilin-type N-terminal cleavage/methylation domain-containing protein